MVNVIMQRCSIFSWYARAIYNTLSLQSKFSPFPILKESYGTLHVCRFPGEEGLVIVDAKTLTDVIGMVPFHRPVQGGGDPNQGEFFPIEKISLTSTQIIEDDDET
jgi:hypothetical protein